jgi:hypothetical protein
MVVWVIKKALMLWAESMAPDHHRNGSHNHSSLAGSNSALARSLRGQAGVDALWITWAGVVVTSAVASHTARTPPGTVATGTACEPATELRRHTHAHRCVCPRTVTGVT